VKVALLDLDGTLVDSLPGITAATNATLGTAHPETEIRQFVGPPLHTTFAALTGRSGAALDETVARYREIYAGLMVSGSVVYPGVVALLQRLKDAGLVLAVATSKAQPLAIGLLDGLGLAPFFATVCGPVPPSHDDKTATIGRALDDLGRPPVAAVTMVGDRHHDIDAAHAHGVRAIGVTWGFGAREELRGADALVDTPAALGDLLLGR
jgi:phosphoglycolate phosphatase